MALDLVLHALQAQDEHLERDVQRAALECRARDEGIGELAGKGRVQPDRRRLGVQRREAELLRRGCLGLGEKLGLGDLEGLLVVCQRVQSCTKLVSVVLSQRLEVETSIL